MVSPGALVCHARHGGREEARTQAHDGSNANPATEKQPAGHRPRRGVAIISEATLQAALIDALSGVVRPGSILINDYHTPQVASRDYAPWLIIETADDVGMTTGASYTTPAVTWELYLSLLTYRDGRDDKEHRDDFQELRRAVLDALATAAPALQIRGVEAATVVTRYFNQELEPDPDSLFQRLAVQVVEYGV